MISSSAIHVSAGDRRVVILHDKLRLTRRFRGRPPLVAHAAIGSQEERGCSKVHAP
jgi:hypothetical protein